MTFVRNGTGFLGKCLNILLTSSHNEINLAPRILCSFEQTRGITGTPKGSWKGSKVRSMRRKRGWARRRVHPGEFDDNLSLENKEFLDEVVEDKYEALSPLKEAPWKRNDWKPSTTRCGVLAVKMGVIPQWTKTGKKFYTTLLQVLDNHAIKYMPPEEYGKLITVKKYRKYWIGKFGSQIIGALSSPPYLFTDDYNAAFEESGVPTKRKLTRFIVTPDAAIEPGTPLSVNHFRIGDFVDVQARTIDHGFQGVIKRWGMKGGRASHGVTKAHRRMGSMGGGGDKSGIWKGKKMPGHMGNAWRILRGLRVWRINTKYNILYLHGPCLPGPNHCYVRIYDTILPLKHKLLKDKPPYMPTWYPEDITEEQKQEEIFHPDLFQFEDETITYIDDKKDSSR